MESNAFFNQKTLEEKKSPYPSSLTELFCEYYKSVPRFLQKEFLRANGCFSKQSALDACLAEHDPHYAKVLAEYQLEDRTSAKFLTAASKSPDCEAEPFSMVSTDDLSWKVASCPPSWERVPLDKEKNDKPDGVLNDLTHTQLSVTTDLSANDGQGGPKKSLLLEYLDLCQRQNTLLTLHLSRGDQVDGRVRRLDKEGVIFRTDLYQEEKKEGETDCYLSLTSILDLTPQEPFKMV